MLTFFGKTGALIVGLTRGDLVHLQAADPIGFSGPKTFPVKDVVLVYGETPLALIDALTRLGLDVPEGLREYARSTEGDDAASEDALWPDQES